MFDLESFLAGMVAGAGVLIAVVYAAIRALQKL